jgi:hypothetical protein
MTTKVLNLLGFGPLDERPFHKLRARRATSDERLRFLFPLGVALCIFALCAPAATAQCAWTEGVSPSLPGVNGFVYATAVFNDGGGDDLYVAGNFTVAGDVLASNIAKWDGSSWSALGSGTNEPVHALTVFDDGGGPALYAGGEFTNAGGVSASHIAKWDGSSWSAVASGTNGSVLALTVFDDGGGSALYAGGEFTIAWGADANYIAKWDGSSWSALGSGTSDTVLALAIVNDGGGPALYAGGEFTTAGGASANRVAKWDGSSWSALGSGMDFGGVNALTVFDDGGGPALYAGGPFFTAGGVAAIHVAKWDGSSWSALGSGTSGAVYALSVFDDRDGPALYAAGDFNTAGGVSAFNIAKWNGSSWSDLDSGIGSALRALAVFDDGGGEALYGGGFFFRFTPEGTAHSIAKWDGSSWSALGSGTDFSVRAMTGFDDGGGSALYVGGSFSTAGGVGANRIARWDGANWSALGSGMNSLVYALGVFDDGGGEALYAGGNFATAGGVGANRIAKWDGLTWSALGSGMGGTFPSSVYALTVFDDGGGPALYAGGRFTVAGGVGANYIAKWDGSSWSALGSGMDDEVHALAVFDDGGGPALYAGGSFNTAGGAEANCIARWDGSSWSALGAGMGNFDFVVALTAFDDGGGEALYAGGRFFSVGGVIANDIAKWNGASWSALGSGMNNDVHALTVFDDGGGPALYAGGDFSTAGGLDANYIAKWDGLSWSALGVGTNGNVFAVTVIDDGGGPALYTGGHFSIAGGNVSAYIAQWMCDCNANDIPDAVDIANCPPATPACADCNGNGVPDECDVAGSVSGDCNSNSIPDECDIANCPPSTSACADCNGNDVPDECDVASLGSDDCNANSLPDECDVSICNPDLDPGCDDCNLNGAPDGCDISDRTSQDLDMSGVPDECIDFLGGCGTGSIQWSCPQNWEGDVVPNNNGTPFSVVLDGDNVVGGADVVVVDIDVVIDSLRMIDGATLSVTGSNLTVAEPGSILSEGLLQVGNGGVLDVLAGDLTLHNGGVYQGAAPGESASGQLNADNVFIGSAICSGAGMMALSGEMVAALRGSLRLEGDDNPPGTCKPELRVHDAAAASAVDLVLQGAVTVAYTSSEPLVLSGDFINQSTSPEGFDFLSGVIEFVSDDGPGPAPQDHYLEVAAEDLGAYPPPAAGDELFLIGEIRVLSGNRLTVRNQVGPANSTASECKAALYVGTLLIDDGAEVVTDSVRLFYESLINNGTTTEVGCGGIVEFTLQMCTVATECGDADNDGVRDNPCWWYSCNAGVCDSLSRGTGNSGQFGQADVGGQTGPGVCNVDGVADGNDRFHALNCFANANFGSPGSYPCEPGSPNALNVDAGSSASCVLDGVCDVNDAFHALNSFSNANFGMPGGYPCTCSGSAPRPSAPRVEPLEHTGLSLRAPRWAAPGELVHVDVHLTDGLAALRGYQLHLSGAGGKRGDLELADISIDSARDDYVFAGVAGVWTAFNRSTGQMLAGMDALEGVPASPGAYLATFSYRVPEDAGGTLVVEVRAGDRSLATQDRTFLFGTYARPIGVEGSTPARIAVEEGNRGRRKR